MKKAILVVSFGTSHEEASRKTIDVIEDKIAKANPDYQVYRAFTSEIIIRKLSEYSNIIVPTVKEAMESLLDEGVTEVIVQPTHIMNGIENEKMLEELEPFRTQFMRMRVGKPLLSDCMDYQELVNCIVNENHIDGQEAILLMGHGTNHHANAVYQTINYTFQSKGYSQVYMATVKGYPTLEDAIGLIKQRQYSKVLLVPFMIVAGEHVKNDMAGDEEYSWKSILIREGYEVDCKLQGLGELEVVQEMFIRHVREAM